MRNPSVVGCVVLSAFTVACGGGSPVAPSGAVAVAPPVYVTIGDSLASGPYMPIVEAGTPGTWIRAGVGSTTITRHWQPEGSSYTAMKAKIGSARPTAFLVHLGANDVVSQPPPTAELIMDALSRLIAGLRTDYPGATIYLADVGEVWTYGDKRVETESVRRAVEQAWTWPQVKRGPMLRDLKTDDGVHFTSDENARVIADRWLAAIR